MSCAARLPEIDFVCANFRKKLESAVIRNTNPHLHKLQLPAKEIRLAFWILLMTRSEATSDSRQNFRSFDSDFDIASSMIGHAR